MADTSALEEELKLELSPYDLGKGRITFRHLAGQAPRGPRPGVRRH